MMNYVTGPLRILPNCSWRIALPTARGRIVCIAGRTAVRADPTGSGDLELWELHEELLREVRWRPARGREVHAESTSSVPRCEWQ